MYTEHDEGRGLVKTNWANVRDRVHKVAPEFAALVDEVNPGNDMPLFLAYYPYGHITSDTVSPIMPKIDSGQYRLSEAEAPKEVFKHLGYGADGSLLTMVLDKAVEMYIDDEEERATIPLSILKSGDMYGLGRFLNTKNQKTYTPIGILNFISGSRSTFMLPYISCATHHANLKRDYKINTPVAKNTYDHWLLFKEIANHPDINCNWHSCLIYFSAAWAEKILNNKKWLYIKLFIYDYELNKIIHRRNKIFYDYIFSKITAKRNLKPNPYLIDIARYLFKIAAGDGLGFEPATDESLLPVNILQTTFIESYGMTKYTPTIMIANRYNFEKNKDPIYYSLQHPILDNFSPKSRKESTALFEMRELAHVIKIFLEELSSVNSLCLDTIIYDLAKRLKFKYFHNKSDDHSIALPSSEVVTFDKRFNDTSTKYLNSKAIFPNDAKFFRGCVAIST